MGSSEVVKRIFIISTLLGDTKEEVKENFAKANHYRDWFLGICHVFNQTIDFKVYTPTSFCEEGTEQASLEVFSKHCLSICDLVAVFSPDGKLYEDMITEIKIAVEDKKEIIANSLETGEAIKKICAEENLKEPIIHYVFEVEYIRNLQ